MTDLAKLKSEYEAVAEVLSAHKVVSADSEAFAAFWIDKVSTASRVLDAARAKEKAPHLMGGRTVDAKYQPAIKLLDRTERELKAKITRWRDTLRAQEAAARREVIESGGQADGHTMALAQAHVSSAELPETIRETSRLEWHVTDESAVPVEYKRTCAELVEAEIERTRGACKIPGIEVKRVFDIARKGVVKS